MRKEKLEELRSLLEQMKTVNMIKVPASSRFITSETYQCKLANGKIITREKLMKNQKDGSAAVILPITTEQEVILMIEPRVFTKRTVGISIPAGYIEEGETPQNAALRELEEETGYIPATLKKVTQFYQDIGCSSAYNHCFVGLNCEKKGTQHLDREEYVQLFTCTFEEALYLVELGYIEDVNTIITLEKVKEKRKEYHV